MKRLFPETSRRKAIQPLSKWWLWVSIAVASVVAIPWLIGPSCPDKIVIATGSESGAYYAFAQQYKEELAQNGIELEIINTAGSVENRQLLRDSKVDIAFIQGGIDHVDGDETLSSLASLYLEPMWVFHRRGLSIEDLSDLKYCKIAIGSEGSGTNDLAVKLLKENQVAPEPGASANDSASQAIIRSNVTQFINLGGDEAEAALLNGDIDAMFAVVSAKSDMVKRMLSDHRVSTLNMKRADGYCTKYRYLSTVNLPEGFFDFAKNIPPQSIQLVAPSANLVARDDIHPALVPLLLDVMKTCHRDGGVFEKPGEFPNDRLVDFSMNRDAQRYFSNGAPFFYKVLPFQFAAWLDQVKLLVFPLITLLFPLVKIAPPIYRWSIRVKIFRWYKILRDIDVRLESERDEFDFEQELERLELLECELANVSVPLSYMEEFYNLKLHVAYVRDQLERKSQFKGGSIKIAA